MLTVCRTCLEGSAFFFLLLNKIPYFLRRQWTQYDANEIRLSALKVRLSTAFRYNGHINDPEFFSNWENQIFLFRHGKESRKKFWCIFYYSILRPVRVCLSFSLCTAWFCMGVKLGLSHCWRNIGWGCLRIGCWGEYLGLRGTSWQGNGENYIMRSLTL